MSKLVSKLLEEEEDDFTLPSTTNGFTFKQPQQQQQLGGVSPGSTSHSLQRSPMNQGVHSSSSVSPSSAPTPSSSSSVTPFTLAIETLLRAHNEELHDLKKSLQEQRDTFDKATLQSQKKIDELVNQNTK
jgi:hypothetical protein